ncbi:MAG: response regulator [Rhodospirillaceae bacterium]|jgi:CheY-like chemotaxis protein|nr:response regulator [Rhodospirillaceae bacterium]MBT3629110.1 response regulator [Rhodospirillaceae bacterium]MBT3928476.1 response regulator [Rhodospirillaceae bacterium]MBT4428461.1 response regulator [Rhodospirillaceae bacterium]MBT5039772.1 response regulator [Rhodospirillaceae bacterium]
MATQSPAGADIVLIADDNASLRSKIVEFLKMEGIQSVEAGDGEMALREAMRVQPAVALLDIKMPTMDGLTAARQMADMPWQPKVILMSGFDDSVRLANKAGLSVFAVLEKPVPLKLLARFVWDALGKENSNRLF